MQSTRSLRFLRGQVLEINFYFSKGKFLTTRLCIQLNIFSTRRGSHAAALMVQSGQQEEAIALEALARSGRIFL